MQLSNKKNKSYKNNTVLKACSLYARHYVKHFSGNTLLHLHTNTMRYLLAVALPFLQMWKCVSLREKAYLKCVKLISGRGAIWTPKHLILLVKQYSLRIKENSSGLL